MNTQKSKTGNWQSFLVLEALDEDLPRIRDDEPARDPFEDWQE